MNHCVLLGVIASDVDVRTSAKGTAIAKFSLAVPKKFSGEKGKRESTFIRCIAFKGVADFCAKYLAKGGKIAIEGAIDSGSYEKGGQKVYYTQVIVNSIEFAGNKIQGANGEGPAFGEVAAPEKPTMDVFEDVTDDVELPFM